MLSCPIEKRNKKKIPPSGRNFFRLKCDIIELVEKLRRWLLFSESEVMPVGNTSKSNGEEET